VFRRARKEHEVLGRHGIQQQLRRRAAKLSGRAGDDDLAQTCSPVLGLNHNECYGRGNKTGETMTALSIEDRLGLQDLIADYSWALDTGDAEALVACFTEDCVMSEEVFEDPDIWEGHDGIRGLMNHYANAPGFPGRQHHVTQVQYRPQDDGTVELRSFAFVTECEGEPPY